MASNQTDTAIHDQSTQSFLNTTSSPTVLAATAMKIPPFWKHAPALWFIQIEAQFRTNRITSDSTRYDHLVSTLDAETMLEVSDLLTNPPEEAKYERLKSALISRFTESEDRQLNTALSGLELGDQKPSQLLRRMTSLAGAKATEDVLRVRWLDLLPVQVQRCLKLTRDLPLSEQADLADELVEPKAPATVMAADYTRSRHRSPHRLPDELLSTLVKEMAEIKLALVQLTSNGSAPTHRPRGRDRNRSSSRARERSSSRSTLCYYHHRFGERARKCEPPCTFNFQPSAGN